MCEGPDSAESSAPAENEASESTRQQRDIDNDGEVSPANPRRMRNNRLSNNSRRRSASPESFAVDLPPPIASLSRDSPAWKTRDCRAITPEFIATLTATNQRLDNETTFSSMEAFENHAVINWSTAPLIVAKRWVVVGTEQGQVCVWKADSIFDKVEQRQLAQSEQHLREPQELDSSESTIDSAYSDILPDHMIDCCSLLADALRDKRSHQQRTHKSESAIAAPIVSLATAQVNESNYYLLAITDTGVVAVILLSQADNNDSVVQLVAGFSTRQTSATCCTMMTANNINATADDNSRPLQDVCIMIGYQTSHVEAWSLQIATPTVKTGVGEPLRSPSSAKLMFRGCIESACDYQVRSMAVLSSTQRVVPLEPSMSSDSTSQDASIKPDTPRQTYVLLVLESGYLDEQLPTPAMIEVLCLDSVVAAWTNSSMEKASSTKTTAGARPHRKEVVPPHVEPLEPHLILAEPGMELVDVRTSTMDGPTPARTSRMRPHWIPTMATNCIHELDDELQIETMRNRNQTMRARCLVALSDGTVAIISAGSTKKNEITSVSWGVTRNQDQMLLSYPAVGLGSVMLDDTDEDASASNPYAVCCLSGTTTYLSPLTSNNVKPVKPFKVTSYPHEIDSDIPVEFVHGFTAGVMLSSPRRAIRDCTSKTTAIMIYAWHGGGLLDVYSCQLMKKSNSHSIISRLVDDGAAEMLRSLLYATCSSSSETVSDEAAPESWQRAHDALVAARKGEGALILHDVCSDELDAFRSLLLQFAQFTTN
ncbi:hypothetical protein MPSEU_000290100 [Mayamaea pseudoterrestris]|nr:hypothetical protein MPSEU_000290100 [Mayamaea pseudoterrestris]